MGSLTGTPAYALQELLEHEPGLNRDTTGESTDRSIELSVRRKYPAAHEGFPGGSAAAELLLQLMCLVFLHEMQGICA